MTPLPAREAVPAAFDADRQLIERDPDVAPLELLFDHEALSDRVRAAQPGDRGAAAVAVHRLRYKPGMSVHAAVRVGDDPLDATWLMFAGYSDAGEAKVAKDLSVARARGVEVPDPWRGDRWMLVPAVADRRLPSRRLHRITGGGGHRVLAYNPRRRLIAADGTASGATVVSKVYAPGTRRPARGVSEALRRHGAPVARTIDERSGVRTTQWVAGANAQPDRDGDHVVEALQRLHRAGGDVALRPWRAEAIAAQVDVALAAVSQVLPHLAPTAGDLAAAVRSRLAEATPGRGVVLHGDLSPDQVVIGSSGVVFVDLDECMIGPAGWDAATWWASQLASGVERPAPLSGLRPPGELLAAAIAMRSNEPFQRRRTAWATTVHSMLDTARRSLDRVFG